MSTYVLIPIVLAFATPAVLASGAASYVIQRVNLVKKIAKRTSKIGGAARN